MIIKCVECGREINPRIPHYICEDDHLCSNECLVLHLDAQQACCDYCGRCLDEDSYVDSSGDTYCCVDCLARSKAFKYTFAEEDDEEEES